MTLCRTWSNIGKFQYSLVWSSYYVPPSILRPFGCVSFQLFHRQFSLLKKRNQNWNKWNFSARKRSQPRFCSWGRWPTRNNISRCYKSIRRDFSFKGIVHQFLFYRSNQLYHTSLLSKIWDLSDRTKLVNNLLQVN